MQAEYDVVIVGGGAAGSGVAASLLKRDGQLKIAIIEPSDTHYYQPAWTLVGAGEFDQQKTAKPMQSCIPAAAKWLQAKVASFQPDQNQVTLDDGKTVSYAQLVVASGLQINWDAIEGLKETLGTNGVTSNYRYDLAPYTWSLVQNMRSGKAIFTQPPMPIKCAGAPQKAMYLSCSEWEKQGDLNNIEVEFANAGPGLFGVKDYVPALMEYVERYQAKLAFSTNLVKVDGPNKKAWFAVKDADGNVETVEKTFDMLHVVPPQSAPDFIKQSPLANDTGWLAVDQHSLQHPSYGNVFALGDVAGTANAKTAAAVRKQVIVVAENLLGLRSGSVLPSKYDGYGSCPLTVEKGKIILAEFAYGGKLVPTFPWDSTKPRKSAWLLKKYLLPAVYWRLLLKGREWLARCSACG